MTSSSSKTADGYDAQDLNCFKLDIQKKGLEVFGCLNQERMYDLMSEFDTSLLGLVTCNFKYCWTKSEKDL